MPPVGIRSGGPLNRMRANALKMMQDTCTIQGMTGSPRAFGTIASNVPCRIEVDTQGSADASRELNMNIVLYRIMLPYNTALTRDYQIVHGGHTYDVWAFVDDQSPVIYKKALLRRVTG